MIATLVEFFLTDEGRQRFGTWVTQLGSCASAYPGFLDVRRLTPVDDPDRTIFLLHFDSMQHTQAWGDSSERGELLTDIQPHWRHQSVISHFDVGPAWTPAP